VDKVKAAEKKLLLAKAQGTKADVKKARRELKDVLKSD
jgi:hypothetical protein